LIIGGVFALFLFLFLHFREVFVETFELGSQAQKYVVAQIDFSFPDEEATIILKQEVGRDIGKIYRIQSDEVHIGLADFQKYVTQSSEGSRNWAHIADESNYADLALALGFFSDGLLGSRFTDTRTMQRVDELPPGDLSHPRGDFFIFLPPQDSKQHVLPEKYWTELEQRVFVGQDIPPPIITFIANYFAKQPWQFEEDKAMEQRLRKQIQAHIPPSYTTIRSGERMIDQGEKVSSRHLAMMQAMKEHLSESRNLLDPLTIAGSLLMTTLFLFVTILYLRENHRAIFYSNRKLALLVTVLLFTLLLAKLTELFLLKNTSNLIDLVRFPLFVPFAAILLTSLMNVRVAAFATVFLSIIFPLALAVESTPFLVINILTATVVILSTRTIRRRKEVFVVCAKAWLASALVILAFNLYENTAFSISFLGDLASTFLFMTLTAILVVGLLPIFESLFQIMTDITLMEFMDPSNQLLRRLTIEAPGTYQHSMVVGNLAEAAATAIGANGLFCRVSTLYHDIGKLANPQYFTENQLSGINMHQLLTPMESAQVIINHVSEGVALARKVGLPEQFIDIIKEHHGTQLVYYFYCKQLDMMGGDKSKVERKDFRYGGPKPRTKESTIIMLADNLEAASRSLDIFNEKEVVKLLDQLIARKPEEGQFDESLLTFEELSIVRKTLVQTLLAASHPRIKYPAHHPGEEG
ncbi:MAG: hypothetical protein K940chlam2_01681, partial [Chlamydiae bacterium]|nr:hypothetical protein [Chlamydiota bacterium]